MVGENAVRMTEVYKKQIDVMPDYVSIINYVNNVEDNISLCLATEAGVVIADNVYMPSQAANIASDPSFRALMQGSPNTAIIHSKHFDSQAIVYSIRIENPRLDNDFLVLRLGLSLHYDSGYFIMMIPIIIVVLLIVLAMTYAFTNTLINNAISPLTYMQKSLADINKGVYHQMDIKSKYRDVQKVINEINIFSSKISNSVNYLNYEQKKSNFILDNMSQGIIAISNNGNVVLTNKATLNVFGTTKNLLGCKLSNLVEDEELVNKISEAIEVRKNILFEREISDKVYRIEVANMEFEFQTEDKGIVALVTFTDITQESQSAKIRSEFFANASHELKTPLTAVKGFSELLPSMPTEDAKLKCAEEITKNTDKMLSLIDDMLKLSKIDASVVDDDAELIDLRKLADTVAQNLEALAIKKNVKISIEGQGKMYGRKKQIDEVVTNLVDNAIKYNKQNGIVKVQIYDKNDTVFLTVEDNGIGIDSVHQSRIFERFYIVDKGRNRKVQSTGLGLAIVKHIVLQHSGKISLESKAGKGTKFTVQFPSAK